MALVMDRYLREIGPRSKFKIGRTARQLTIEATIQL